MSRCFLAKMNFEREFRSVSSDLLNKGATIVVAPVSPFVLYMRAIYIRSAFVVEFFFPAHKRTLYHTACIFLCFPTCSTYIHLLMISTLARVNIYHGLD